MAQTNLQQNIFTELQLDQLPVERQQEILMALTELFLKKITLKVLDNLSEQQRQEFDALITAGEPEKISDFLAKNIQNYEQLVAEEIEHFKKEIKETMEALAI